MPSRLSSRAGVPWSVSPFLPAVSLLARIVFISSRRASRRASRSSSRSIHVSLGYRLIVLSCRGVLLARLVFFSFVLSPSPSDLDMAFLRGRRAAASSRWACDSPPLRLAVRSFLACLPRKRDAASVPVLRHTVMSWRGRQGMGRTER